MLIQYALNNPDFECSEMFLLSQWVPSCLLNEKAKFCIFKSNFYKVIVAF